MLFRRATVALLAATCTALGPVGDAHAAAPTPFVKGIDVYVASTCQSPAYWQQEATNEAAAVASLGANTLGINFPVYTASAHANTIFARSNCTSYQSPTPAQLGVVIAAARADHLNVFLRPTLSQGNLVASNPKLWHGKISPSNPRLWFRNYLAALRPYLALAQATHVTSFAISGELTSMARYPYWATTIAQAHALFHGQLVFTASWSKVGQMLHKPGTSLGVDAYQPVTHAPVTASVATLLAGWNRDLKANPIPGTTSVTVDEVGIPALNGLYAGPNGADFSLTRLPFNPLVQAQWFTMACAFVHQHHMRGLFYWGATLQDRFGRLLNANDPAETGNFQPAAQHAIKACFAH